MLSGDNGILQRTTEAKEKSERAQIIENSRLDILAQIAENKGEDISEEQFKTVLNKYFYDVPNTIPDDLSDLNLTSIKGYTVKGNEIYDGKLKASTPGLYYAGTNDLIMSWEKLLESNGNPPMLSVSNGNLSKASFNINTQVKLIVDKTVTSIGYMGGISQLEEIKLPDTVTTIYPGALGGNNNLKTVTILSGNIGSGAFGGCPSIEKVVFGDKVTSIGVGAFNGCSSLKKIDIPDSVTNLGDESFKGCTSLEEIKIGNGGVNISGGAFGNDNSIKTIEIKAGTLGAGAFSGKPDLETIKLGKDVNISASSIFGGCSELSDVYLEEGIASIGEWCFGGCKKLTNINIPNSVTSIGDRAFQNCPLNTIFINSSNIGKEAFEYTSLTSITIGPNVRNIGEKAFNSLEVDDKVVDIKIQEGLTKIGECAFANYSKYPALNITLPNTLLSIEKEAFLNCRMTEIKIPKSVTSIANDAFKNCINLQNIIIEKDSTLTAPSNKWGANNATVIQE